MAVKTKPKTDARDLAIAHDLAGDMFRGRKGHGGGPCTKRNLTETRIGALIVIALERAHAAEMRATLRAVARMLERRVDPESLHLCTVVDRTLDKAGGRTV